MEKIRKLAKELADECEREGVPLLLVYGVDHISGEEYAPENTPDLFKKARAVLFNSTSRARRQLEIQA